MIFSDVVNNEVLRLEKEHLFLDEDHQFLLLLQLLLAKRVALELVDNNNCLLREAAEVLHNGDVAKAVEIADGGELVEFVSTLLWRPGQSSLGRHNIFSLCRSSILLES